jgi:hypothetical protein
MIWNSRRRRRKAMDEAVQERKKSEASAMEAQEEVQKLRKMGEENHFANAIIESVLKGYGDR